MTDNHNKAAKVRLGRFSINLPGRRWQRTLLGVCLCIGGFLGFLPVLGFWMLPLGILVLSVEYHPVRRFRRRVEVWWFRRQRKKKPV